VRELDGLHIFFDSALPDYWEFEYSREERALRYKKQMELSRKYQARHKRRTWKYNTKLYAMSYRSGYFFKFRNDPIPGTGKRKNRSHYWKYSFRLQERKNFEEYKEYFPGKNPPEYLSTWDDIEKSVNKHTDKDWKRLKVKKQYMKNFKKHQDTVKFDRREIDEGN